MTDELNIIDWMVMKCVAKNVFQASHISAGLHLPDIDRQAQEAKCLLYRKWRPKTDKKDPLTALEAFDLTNAGIDPDNVPARQIELFEVAQ
jgi:hypothetical protein